MSILNKQGSIRKESLKQDGGAMLSSKLSSNPLFEKEKKQNGQQIGNKNQDYARGNAGSNYSQFRKEQKDVNDRINDFFQAPAEINQLSKSTDSDHSQDNNKNKLNITQKDREQLEKELKSKKKTLMSSPIKPYNWNKLSIQEKNEAFMLTYKNNLDLKKRQNSLENQLKQLNTKLIRLQKEVQFNSRNLIKDKDNNNINYDELEQIKQENNKLKQKIDALSSVKKLIDDKKSSNPAKKLIKTVNQIEIEQNLKEMNQQDRQKISEMLKLIDAYKEQLRQGELEIKRLQNVIINEKPHDRGAHSLNLQETNSKIKDLHAKQDQVNSHFEANRQLLEQARAELKEMKQKFQKEQLTNQDLKTEIEILKINLKTYEKLEEELAQVKAEKRQKEKEIQQLATDPLFGDFKNQSANEIKYRETREENFKLKEQVKNLKEIIDKTNEKLVQIEKKYEELQDQYQKKKQEYINVKSQLEILQKGAILGDKMSDFTQNDFINALGLVKWDGEDPLWLHLENVEKQRVQDLFAQSGDNVNEYKKKVENLILEKGELALHLERQATMLRTKIQIDKEKEKLHKMEVEQLYEQLKVMTNKADELAKLADIKGYVHDAQNQGGLKVYEKDNVKYTNDISEFTTDDMAEEELGPGENIFDLYIGKIDIDENEILKQNENINETTGLLTFFTIDFYNHDTQHSSVVEGIKNNYQFQASFKIKVDEFYITYLKERFIKLELYCAQQQNALLLGSANVSLAQLISENTKPNISAVIEQTVRVRGLKSGILSDKFIGCVNVKFRMRYPISKSIEWAQEKLKLNIQQIKQSEDDMFQDFMKKKIIIKVDKGVEMPANQSLFVYFQLNGKDYISPTQIGPSPDWQWEIQIDVVVDENFRQFLKNDFLNFTVFNDSIPIEDKEEEDDDNKDVVGIGKMSLKSLLEGEVVNPNVQIFAQMKNQEVVNKGTLHVLVYWYEGWGQQYKPKYEHMLLTRNWETDITMKIARAFKQKGIALATAFYVMNRDQDLVISMEDFNQTVNETLQLGLNPNEIDAYYNRLPQPFNKQNFESVFRNYLLDVQTGSEDYLLDEIIQQQQQRNKQPSISNTSGIQRKFQSQKEKQLYESSRIKISALISKKLKTRSIQQIFNEIDQDGNGKISIFNLSSYLSIQGQSVTKEEIYQFLKVLDFNGDNNIDINEFKSFLKGESDQLKTLDQKLQMNFIYNIKYRILQFLKGSEYSFSDLFKIIDNDRSGFINSFELLNFVQDKLRVKLKFEEIFALINYFDKNNDDQIDLYELVDGLRQEANKNGEYQLLFQKEQVILTTIEEICDKLNNYMQKNNVTRGQLFDKFDQNNDKFISKSELKKTLQNLQINLNTQQFNEFYSFLDKNNDEKVSIQEFIQTMKTELQRIDGKRKRGQSRVQQNSQQQLRQQIIKKVESDVRKHRTLYLRSFEEKSNNNKSIQQSDFKKILKDLSDDINDTEIDYITQNLVQQDNKGNIIYSTFLNINDDYMNINWEQNIYIQDRTQSIQPIQGSQYDFESSQSEQIAKQIFAKFSRILRQSKIDYEHAFQRFDKNKDKTISRNEFKKAFKDMELPFKEYEIDQVFSIIDKNNDGTVTLDEFVGMLNYSTIN